MDIQKLLKDIDDTFVNLGNEGRDFSRKRERIHEVLRALEDKNIAFVPYIIEDKPKMYFSTFVCDFSDEEMGIKGDICHIGSELIIDIEPIGQFKFSIEPIIEQLVKASKQPEVKQ